MKTLIRLDWCAGWSRSSHSEFAQRYVFAWRGLFYNVRYIGTYEQTPMSDCAVMLPDRSALCVCCYSSFVCMLVIDILCLFIVCYTSISSRTLGRQCFSRGVALVTWYMSQPRTKPTKWHVRPAKTQISLGIRPVWLASSLCAQWVDKDPWRRRNRQNQTSTNRANVRKALRFAHSSPSELIAMLKGLKNKRTK